MRWLLFLSRVAFICGVFFLLALSLLIKDWAKDDAITSTVITIGFIMGVVIVPVTALCYLVVVLIKQKLTAHIPAWLIAANILFLFVLLFYIFYVNPHYHQG